MTITLPCNARSSDTRDTRRDVANKLKGSLFPSHREYQSAKRRGEVAIAA